MHHWELQLVIGGILIALGLIGWQLIPRCDFLERAVPECCDGAENNGKLLFVVGCLLVATHYFTLTQIAIGILLSHLVIGLSKVLHHPYRQELAGADVLAIIVAWPVLGKMIEHWK